MASHLLTLTLLAGVLLTPSLNAAPSLITRTLKPHAAPPAAKTPARMPQLRGQHHPTKIESSTQQSGKWTLDKTETYTYDTLGRITTKIETTPDGHTYPHTYTYVGDTHNVATETDYSIGLDGTSWIESTRDTYTYDSIVPDLVIVRRTELNYNATTNPGTPNWNTVDYEQTLITRNPQGSITHLEYSSGHTPESLTPEYRLSYTIDPATGHPTAIDQETYSEGQWTITAAYSDLQWYACNGQILSLEDLLEKPGIDNRIKSATFELYEEETSGTATFTYPDERGSMNLTANGTMQNLPFNLNLTLKILDDNGSYNTTSKAIANLGFMKIEMSGTEETIYDPFGLLLSYRYDSKGLEGTTTEEKTGTPTYDPATGAPLTYTITEAASDPGVIVNPPTRYTFTYGDPSSLPTTITPDATPALYYDLNGRQLPTHPATPGLYLLRQGTHTSKILVK